MRLNSPTWLAVALGLALGLEAFGQEVEVRDGNVYYADEHKRTRQLTAGGTDSYPTLSPDGATVIFVRRTSIPVGFEEPTNLHPVRNQICLVDAAADRGSKVVLDGPITVGRRSYATFIMPHLAPDNRHAYFLIDLSATELGLVWLDLATGLTRMICTALDWHIVASGRYAGDLVVQQRRHQDSNGSYYAYWLLSEDGKELGFVGESEREALAFLKNPNRQIK